MIKNLVGSILITVTLAFSNLFANVEYDIQDIGILQTHSSQAIAINNQGQILGWYNLDGSKEGKQFFVRNRDGSFYEIQAQRNIPIEWKYLTNNGNVYGIFSRRTNAPISEANVSVLYMWDLHSGVVKLGDLPGVNQPGREIVTINDSGQVLISLLGWISKEGKLYKSPAIWHNGEITHLHGLVGDLGIEAEESSGRSDENLLTLFRK